MKRGRHLVYKIVNKLNIRSALPIENPLGFDLAFNFRWSLLSSSSSSDVVDSFVRLVSFSFLVGAPALPWFFQSSLSFVSSSFTSFEKLFRKKCIERQSLFTFVAPLQLCKQTLTNYRNGCPNYVLKDSTKIKNAKSTLSLSCELLHPFL